VEVERQPADENLLGTAGRSSGDPIEGPVRVTDAETGATVALVAPFPGDLGLYRRALLSYPMDTTVRSGGIRNRSRVFGFSARQAVLRRTSCRACSGSVVAPLAHRVIAGAAVDLGVQLSELLDGAAEQLRRAREVIKDDWFIVPGALWTSGVVNATSPLPYHRDGNNVGGCWSAMVVCRRGVRGGFLHVPEYDLTLACRDGDVVYFDGHELIHGVTPMRQVAANGYRMTAVYYTVERMKGCLSSGEELEAGRVARTSAEDDQIERQRAAGYLE
jgi:hypothetical protein